MNHRKKRSHYLGFTLIEAIISLLLIMCLLSLMAQLIKPLKLFHQEQSSKRHIAWHLFLIQLEDEMTGGTLKEVEQNYIKYTKKVDGETKHVKIAKYRHMIRKTEGHQPLLMEVKQVSFEQIDATHIQIKVTFESGELKEGRVPCVEKETK